MNKAEIIENLKSMRAFIDSILSSLSPAPAKPTARGSARSTSPSKDPIRVELGRNSGKYTSGIPKAKTSRRPYGSVGLKNMTLEEKRAYWRWAKANQAERRRLAKAENVAKLEAEFDESVKNGGGLA